MTTESYPLAWPPGRPRTKPYAIERSKFDTSPGRALSNMQHELRLLRATHIVISTNVELRQDGMPYTNRRPPDDAGVAVYFTHNDKQMVFACDRWQKVHENMHAIGKTIEALRGIARWGTGDMLQAAFAGFAALPPPIVAGMSRPWWEVLGVPRDAKQGAVIQAYRGKAGRLHPDKGGSDAAMAELNQARDAAMQEAA